MEVVDYVVEEVRRQGHDPTRQEGMIRVAWMLEAWSHVLILIDKQPKPRLKDALLIGNLIEPERNAHVPRRIGVRVGMNPCPPPGELSARLQRLWDLIDEYTPLEFYKEFELIHPFVDGNGRAGKILLNWLNGSLLDPIFPPNDLFGRPIRNP